MNGSGTADHVVATPASGGMRGLLRSAGRLFRRRVVLYGTVVFAVLVLVAVFADVLAPHDPMGMNVRSRLSEPSGEFWLGTDNLGRDIFSRLVLGARISLIVGFASVVASTIVGVIIGTLAGFYNSMDTVLMRIMDGLMAFPVILLAVALMAALGPTLENVIIALSAVYAPRTARIVRSAVLSVKRTPYVEAAGALGGRHPRIIVQHVLPNCMSLIIVQATFIFAYAVQAEAALSFLGVGVPPSVPSWGSMLSEARLYMTQAPWMMLAPGSAIAITVLALNAVGDGLRDFLDPQYINR
ncbi:MAG: ABC transporter permease [Trueperaceae bacterium]